MSAAAADIDPAGTQSRSPRHEEGRMRLKTLGLVLSLAVLWGATAARAQAPNGVLFSSDGGWAVVPVGNQCRAIVNGFQTEMTFWARDPNVHFSWTGGCSNGLISGTGVLTVDFHVQDPGGLHRTAKLFRASA